MKLGSSLGIYTPDPAKRTQVLGAAFDAMSDTINTLNRSDTSSVIVALILDDFNKEEYAELHSTGVELPFQVAPDYEWILPTVVMQAIAIYLTNLYDATPSAELSQLISKLEESLADLADLEKVTEIRVISNEAEIQFSRLVAKMYRSRVGPPAAKLWGE